MGENFYAFNEKTKELTCLGKMSEFDRVPNDCIIIGEYSEEYKDLADLYKKPPEPEWRMMCPKCKKEPSGVRRGNMWVCSCGEIFNFKEHGELRQYTPSYRKYTVVRKVE